jgi:hypothetical protein
MRVHRVYMLLNPRLQYCASIIWLRLLTRSEADILGKQHDYVSRDGQAS